MRLDGIDKAPQLAWMSIAGTRDGRLASRGQVHQRITRWKSTQKEREAEGTGTDPEKERGQTLQKYNSPLKTGGFSGHVPTFIDRLTGCRDRYSWWGLSPLCFWWGLSPFALVPLCSLTMRRLLAKRRVQSVG